MRRRRRRIRRIGFGSLLSALLIAFLFAANRIDVSPRPAATTPSPAPLATRLPVEPRRSEVPVPVFHPSVLLDALETEIPDVASLDLELREIDGSLGRMRLAETGKPFPTQGQSPSEQVRADLIRLSALELHLLEIIEPRPQVDPPMTQALPGPLESPTAAGPETGLVSEGSISGSTP